MMLNQPSQNAIDVTGIFKRNFDSLGNTLQSIKPLRKLPTSTFAVPPYGILSSSSTMRQERCSIGRYGAFAPRGVRTLHRFGLGSTRRRNLMRWSREVDGFGSSTAAHSCRTAQRRRCTAASPKRSFAWLAAKKVVPTPGEGAKPSYSVQVIHDESNAFVD